MEAVVERLLREIYVVAEAAQTDLEQEQLNNGFPESNKSRFYQD